MKLRVRSVQSKQTLKIEVPNSCTFEQLEQTLCATLSCSSPSLRLSLNSKDELHPTSPQDTLQSLGITSGDLVYFTLNLDDRSPSNPSSSSSVQGRGQVLQGNLREPLLNNSVNFHESGELGSYVDEKQETLIGVQAGEVTCEESGLYESQMSQFASGESNMNDTQMGEKLENHEVAALEGMDVDIDASSVVDVGDKKFSEPYFLRRVLREEFSGDGGKSKLLVTALHAVFLDSGFVSLDSSGRRVDQLNLPEEWPSKVFQLSLQYTLPELLGDENQNDTVVESVVLKLQSLGHFVNVYGNLSKGGSGPYCVCLDEDRFAPIIDVMWANCDKDDKLYEYDGLTRSYPENEVLQFWKIVKDGIALPLLIDLCENTGLALPSCFMRLPTELKLKILESLSGVDIAVMESVCVEMRYLSSNNDLWKQKLEEEFDSGTVQQVFANWKERFAWRWEIKKRHNEEANAREVLRRPFRPPLVIREPHPFPFPFARPQRRLPPFISFLAVEVVPRRELQLVGISSMLIACKYEEIWAPEVNDFVCVSDNAYLHKRTCSSNAESNLGQVRWFLTVPTPYVFRVRYAKASVPSDNELLIQHHLLRL